MGSDAASTKVDEQVPARVVFLCTANRIRSVFAEYVAKELDLAPPWVRERGILSRGAAAMPDQPATPEAVSAARRFGLDLTKHRSRPLTSADLVDAWVLAMAPSHLAAVENMAGGRPWRAELLGSYGDIGPIADPVGLPAEGYFPIFDSILGALREWSDEADFMGAPLR